MILAALVLQAAAPQSAVDAERAMAEAALREGQWTAVRRFAAPDAVVLDVDGAVPVAEAYAGPDPDTAFRWWVSESFVSCDGRAAVNTGPWERNGRHGWFTTVWQRQVDGSWKWIVDHGGELETPRARPLKPRVVRAACGSNAEIPDRIVLSESQKGFGQSPDESLRWSWTVMMNGRRLFSALLRGKYRYETVIEDDVAGAAE